MNTPENGDRAALRALIDARVAAVKNRDVNALMAGYAAEVVTFDIVESLMNAGDATVRQRVVDWFASFESAIDYEVRGLRLVIGGDVAFGHNFTHVRGTNKAGAKIDMWFRESVGFRKQHGRWFVTHQHSSVPLDMTSGKGRMDLAP